MALLNDQATTLALAIHKPKPNHKLITYSRKRKAGILRDTVGSYNRMKRAKSGDGEENGDNEDNNGCLTATAVDGGKAGSSNRDTEESDVEQSSRKHAGSKEGNIRNEGVARANGGRVEGGKEDEEGEKEGEDEEAEIEGQEGEDGGEDRDQETPIKCIVAFEMRKASESTAPVLHALVQWLGYKDTDSMTWEVLDSPVADWKPYYKKAWKREEFFMTRIWASRKVCTAGLILCGDPR
ncbi:hypothetical protein ACEPPN_012311 [Leptodophora sp. 'Broadleaf-Isolate-01']